MDISVTQHADKDGRVQVRGVNHADVAGCVVEVLQLLRERAQKGRQVVVVEESLVSRCVGQLCGRETIPQSLAGQIVKRMFVNLPEHLFVSFCMLSTSFKVYLCNTGPEIAPHEKLVSFQLRLDDDEGKVGLGVHVARHLFHLFNLRLDASVYALKQAVRGPSNSNVSVYLVRT